MKEEMLVFTQDKSSTNDRLRGMCPTRKLPLTTEDTHVHNAGKRLPSRSVMIKDDAEHPSRKPPWTVRFHEDVFAPAIVTRKHAKGTSLQERALTPTEPQAKDGSDHVHHPQQHHRKLPLRDRHWQSRPDPAILFKGRPKESVPLTRKRLLTQEDPQVYSHGNRRTREGRPGHLTSIGEDDPRWHRLYKPHPTNWDWNVSE